MYSHQIWHRDRQYGNVLLVNTQGYKFFSKTANIIYKKLQTVYLMLYKRQIKKTAKIKNISTNVSVSLYISSVISSVEKPIFVPNRESYFETTAQQPATVFYRKLPYDEVAPNSNNSYITSLFVCLSVCPRSHSRTF